MPASKSKTADRTPPRSPELAALELPLAVGSAVVQAWADMGAEVVRFVWDRLQQDIKTQQAMLACTSLEEMRQIQAEFYGVAQEQYAAEAARMLSMMGRATASGVKAPVKARRYDDVPL